VIDELDVIVRRDSLDPKGIYPGQEFLNQDFNFFTLRDNLLNHELLHIATHSEFVPGRANQSYLLLGTGEKLAIPTIKTWLDLRNINTVVLSACETALGGPGLDGREIAAIGYYFLKSGASNVVASLWNVDDQSTRILMEQFYENLSKGTPDSPVMKAKALRQAQLRLLNGGNPTDPGLSRLGQAPRVNAPQRSQSAEQEEENLPPTSNTSNRSPFRHPYYWSPFILMGSGM
jgi:CHAT domain-containing protein